MYKIILLLFLMCFAVISYGFERSTVSMPHATGEVGDSTFDANMASRDAVHSDGGDYDE